MLYNQQIDAKLVRVARSAEVLTPTAQASTNSFADVTGSKIDTLYRESLAMVMKNTHGANGLSWKVLASIDDVTYVEVQASANLAAAATGSYTEAVPKYRYYKVQIKSQTNDQAAEGTMSVIAK